MTTLPSSLLPRTSADCTAYTVAPEQLIEALLALKSTYPMLVDITALDHGVEAKQRFEVLYHLFSHITHTYCRVSCGCFSNISPSLPSACAVWPAANWHEREAYDLMGIQFEGHPNMKRILMWEGYPYHPLRKDFPLAGIPTPLPAADVTEATGGTSVIAAPMAGGPFVAKPQGAMSAKEPRAKDESWNEAKPKGNA